MLDAPEPHPADCVPYQDLVTGRAARLAPVADQHALAAISYTGGTTGTPKGVMLSHANLLANARHNLIATGHRSSDRWLHVCPMFHVAGTANVLACTWTGARQFVLPRFAADAVLDAIERERITHTVLVPTMLAMLLDADAATPRGLDSLRHVQYAAAPISAALQRRASERLDCDLVQFYGMTEAAPTVTCASAEDHRRGFAGVAGYVERLGSIGAPVIGVEAEVRGADGQSLPSGEVGEIWVRGPNVMLGYWKRPQATEAALRDGWYRSGDLAYAREDGYLYLVDRLKDMIITGGENVYSVEVEAALADHAEVREVAVFGVPDARWGEAVHAVVVVRTERARRGGADRACARADRRLQDPALDRGPPRTIAEVGAGKLLKNILREPFWVGRERRV